MVAIGVSGHRILTEIDKIIAGIDEALQHIERAFPRQSLTVISALAEGGDRLVAERVLAQPRARLVVPLLLPAVCCAHVAPVLDQQTVRICLEEIARWAAGKSVGLDFVMRPQR